MTKNMATPLAVAMLAVLLGSSNPVWAEEPAAEAQRFDKAIEHFSAAIKENPFSAEAYLRRGVSYRNKKEYAAALQDYDKAIAIDPSLPGGFNAKAWLLATCSDAKVRNPSMALELAMTANRLTPQPNMDYLDTLAAAQAANGNFPLALETLKQAIAMAEQANNHEAAADMKKRQSRYGEGKPWQP